MTDTRVLITAEADQAIAEFNRLRAEGSASLNQLANQGSRTLGTLGMSAAQHAQALRMIPAQVTDIVVSLQSGQAPLTVLLQQGGQLRDMFGSTGAAARALGGYVVGLVNPYTVAAAAGLALAVAYNQGSKEADSYRRAIELTGGAAGATADQMADMARQIGETVGTQAAASEAVAALAGTGQVGVENLKAFSQVAVESERAIGKSVADTAADFAELGKSPLRASEKLTEQYHYLTAAVYVQIKALEDQGKMDEAGAVAQKAYADAMGDRSARIVANLGLIEKAWTGVTDFAKRGWDAMLDVGRSDTIDEKLAKAEAALVKAQRNRLNFAGGGADGMADVDNAQKAVAALKEQRDAQLWNAKVKADGVKLDEASIAWLKDGAQYLSKQARLEQEILAVREKGLAAGVADAEINERIGQVRKKYSELNNSGIAALEAKRGLEQEMISGELAALDSQRNRRLVNEQSYINAKRDLQLRDLDAERALVQKQADLAGGKSDLAEREKYLGALAILQQRRKNIIQQADNAQAELSSSATRAISAQAAAWDRASATEQAALQGEVALFGKTAEARKIVAAQVQVDADARKLLDAWQERGHVASGAERAELDKLAAARKASIGAIMGEQQARAGAEQLRLENLKSAAMANPDQKGRALAALEQDADVWRERVRLAGEGTAAQKLLQTEFDTWYANQKRKVLIDVDLASATELLKIVEAVDEATKSAAAGMAASFGRVGTAIGSLTTALSGYSRAQAAIAAQLASATKDAGGDTTKIAKANAAAAQQGAQAQIKSYGDMAGAAKGFFKENTTGYRALEGAEKAYRAVETAMAVQAMVTKLFTVNSVTAATVAGEATKATAVVAGTATQLASDAVKGTSAAALAVATQAQGDPYTAWGRMAAMAAVMAGLGFAVAGGGGRADTTAADRQKAAGTGSILGDSSAKSDSIARSLELAAANSSIELSHTAGMLASLRNIESSISGLGNLLVRNSGLTGELAPNSKGAAYDLASSMPVTALLGGVIGLTLDKLTGGLIGKVTGSIANAIFGGKVTTLDTGLTATRTSLGGVLSNGLAASQYTDTKKDGGLFHSDKYNTSLASLGAEANDQITKVITGLATGVTEAGKLLGVGGDQFAAHLNTFVVDIGKVSLKGLTGEAIQKQLETVFAKVGDDLAKFGVAGLDQFQKVGEGYFETLARVATNYANLDSVLAASGSTFGQTGIASIAARERLIELTGGISELASKSTSFNDNFLTESQRLAPVQKYVTDQLAAMGLASIDTRDKFRDTVLGLASSGALATEAGAKQYAGLLDLADAFAKTHAATVDLTMSQQAIADQRKDLQDQYDELTMTAAQLQKKAGSKIDVSNKPLWDSVQVELARNAAAEEANTILALQAQMYEASGDKAGAAAVLLQQHKAALVDLSPALAAATQATWDAQAAAKAKADAAAEESALLQAAGAMYEANGDKAGAAAVLLAQHKAALVNMTPALAAATQAMWDAQAAAKAKADAAAEESALLQAAGAMYEANGDKAGAAAVLLAQHKAALVNMTPALAAATQAMWDAQAAAKVQSQRASIELSIAQLLGNTTLSRERELAALEASNRALQQRAYALADADQAVSAALAGVQRAIDAKKTAIQTAADAQIEAIRATMDSGKLALDGAQKSVDKLKDIFDDITGAVKTLRGNVAGRASMASAQSFIDMALSLARGGAMPDAERLKDAINVVTQDKREAYASISDFQYAQLVQAGKLEELGKLAGTQKTLAERQFDALTNANKLAEEQIKAIEKSSDAQVKALDAQWKAAQDAVSVMRGVDVSVKSVGTAIQALNGTLATLAATRANASAATGISGNLPTNSTPVSNGSTAPAGGQSGQDLAVPAGAQKALTSAQQAYFDYIKGSAGDVAEKYEYVAGLQDVQAMVSLDALKGVKNDPRESSDDYMRRHGYIVNAAASDPKTRYVPAFAAGGDHAGGLRLVGERGMELEATGPSRIWNFEQTRQMLLGGGGNKDEVAALVRMLIKQNERLEAQNKRLEGQLSAIRDNTLRTRDLLDQTTSGGNAMRCEVVRSVAVAG
ncbi:hypothetical protein ASC94_09235 [Massilia sp. Root418]|uniref:phage tail length tape measure family protein n=1 Tax=Massilia sp. Root418 TaxID=1736532 RepID=UPI0006F34EF3|nr:phage tail length tape measure family protein [Massilia sp. Root418]KQW96980.1 hypothetical protein ASC94_09235 [Massilia sp. Root418]